MAAIPSTAVIELYQCCKPTANIDVKSPATDVYNCIAYAMGSEDIWVASGGAPYGWCAWWPAGVARDLTPESLIAAFKAVGFEQCDNALPEAGYDKVVLYRRYDDKLKCVIWTHAARVVGVHRLHSKFGRIYDAQHNDGDVFEGYLYGEEYAYMRRRESDRNLTALQLPKQSHVRFPDGEHLIVYQGAQILRNIKLP